MIKEKLKNYKNDLYDKNSYEIVKWVFDNFNNDDIAFSTSFGAEDQVLTDIILNQNRDANIFTLDTGRLHEETYQVFDRVCKKYNRSIEVLYPDTKKLGIFVNNHGINSFYDSLENRKKCCYIRKVEPLTKRLSGLKVWITGLRRDQSVTREDLNIIDFDENLNILKLSPLVNWSEDDVWVYIKDNNIPYNSLHDKNFPSIGCEPCTRAVNHGEDLRSGRWWWENPQHKECGLHIKDGKIVPGRS